MFYVLCFMFYIHIHKMATKQCNAQTNSGSRCSRDCTERSRFCTQHKQLNQHRQMSETLSKATHPNLGRGSPFGMLDSHLMSKISGYIPRKKQFSITNKTMNASENIRCVLSQKGTIIAEEYIKPRRVFTIDSREDLDIEIFYESILYHIATGISDIEKLSFTIPAELLETGEKLAVFEKGAQLYDLSYKMLHSFTHPKTKIQ